MAALTVALLVCVWQADMTAAFRLPEPTVVAEPGRAVTVSGVKYRLESFEVAETMPDVLTAGEQVYAMGGATLVVAVFSEVVVDTDKNLEDHFCDLSLSVPDGRRWSTSDLAYKLTTESASCRGSEDNRLQPGQPLRVAGVFEVPQSIADRVVLRVRLSTDGEMVEFRR